MSRVKKPKTERANAPHFNVLDAVIIILIVAAVVGIYFRHEIIDVLTDDKNTDEYVVSFSIENVRHTTPSYIHVGDNVYFKSDGELMGSLMSASENELSLDIAPALEYFTKSNGEIKAIRYPNEESRIDATGRLLCKGNYDENGGFSIDGDTYIAAGQSIEVYTEKVSFVLKVISIEVYEEQG